MALPAAPANQWENLMTPRWRVALLAICAAFIVFFGAAAYFQLTTDPRAAQENTNAVWIALLKGFSGPVYYVGSENGFAYFRLGQLFWTYYKVPERDTRLQTVFPLGEGKPYLVDLKNVPNP